MLLAINKITKLTKGKIHVGQTHFLEVGLAISWRSDFAVCLQLARVKNYLAMETTQRRGTRFNTHYLNLVFIIIDIRFKLYAYRNNPRDWKQSHGWKEQLSW